MSSDHCFPTQVPYLDATHTYCVTDEGKKSVCFVYLNESTDENIFLGFG